MQKGIMLKKYKKNKAYVIRFSFASFVNIASFPQQYLISRSSISSCCFFVYPPRSSTPQCLSGKDIPRAFGASFRRHAAPRTLVLTFFSLASIPLLRLSRTL